MDRHNSIRNQSAFLLKKYISRHENGYNIITNDQYNAWLVVYHLDDATHYLTGTLSSYGEQLVLYKPMNLHILSPTHTLGPETGAPPGRTPVSGRGRGRGASGPAVRGRGRGQGRGWAPPIYCMQMMLCQVSAICFCPCQSHPTQSCIPPPPPPPPHIHTLIQRLVLSGIHIEGGSLPVHPSFYSAQYKLTYL